MRISRLHFSIVMLAALVLLASCGGSSTALLSEQGTQETFMGIQNGDFKAVRFNEAGYRDSALNPTMDIQTVSNGNTTTVVVEIDDNNPTYGVAMNLHYDTSKYTPETIEFSGLVDEPIELSASKGDYVALAQASLAGQAVRNGEFAVVTFANTPNRSVSASGDPHHATLDRVYNSALIAEANHRSGFEVTKNTAEDGSPATATIYGVFAVGDGDQNSESNSGDIIPLVALGWFLENVSDTNFAPAVVDYDMNGEVSSSDLATLAAYFGEVTNSIDILLGDDTTFTTDDVAVDNLDWFDGTYTTPTPETALTTWDPVFRTWTIEADPETLAAADTNEDGTVYVSARTRNTTGVGPAFEGIALTYTVIDNRFNSLIVDAEIVTGAGTVAATDGTTLDVIANEELTLNVTGMSGVFDGATFTAADRGTVVPEADYDATLAAVISKVQWTTTLDAGMIATTEGISNPAQVTGSEQTVMVFPDDDPDYGVGNPEGTLVVEFTAGGDQVDHDFNIEMPVNVAADVDVPVISAVYSDQSQVDGGDNWYLNPVGETLVNATFTFGGIVVAEADFGDIDVQLFNLSDGPVIDLEVIDVATPLSAGTAYIREDLDTPGTFHVQGIVGISAIPGATYGIRLAVPDGESMKWTSINKPGVFFEVAPPPAAVDYLTLPGASEIGPAIDQLWIYYPDPRIRRNPAVDFVDGSIIPEDMEGYQDILKDNGAEFALTSLGGTEEPVNFPVVTVANSTDPSTITATTNTLAGVSVVLRTPGYTVVDIATLTIGGMTATENYAFKVFGAAEVQENRPTLGTGLFNVAPMDFNPPAVAGVDFGINIFDDAERGDLELGDRDYTNKNLVANSILTATPDVLFVELNGGRSDTIDGSQNVSLIFEDTVSSAVMEVPLSIRVIGVGMGNLNRIGIHEFVLGDFDDVTPGSTGILDPGNTYNLILNSPLQPGSEDYTFTDVLVVTGTNPNS